MVFSLNQAIIVFARNNPNTSAHFHKERYAKARYLTH